MWFDLQNILKQKKGGKKSAENGEIQLCSEMNLPNKQPNSVTEKREHDCRWQVNKMVI